MLMSESLNHSLIMNLMAHEKPTHLRSSSHDSHLPPALDVFVLVAVLLFCSLHECVTVGVLWRAVICSDLGSDISITLCERLTDRETHTHLSVCLQLADRFSPHDDWSVQ